MVFAFFNSRRRIAAGFLTLAALLLLAAPLRAQESPEGDATKRKVKTRVFPEYPLLAKQMSVTGKVKIEVTITPDGKVSNTRTVGGSPVLVGAAVEAAKKWKFEPAPKDTVEIIEFEFKDPNM